MLDIDGDSDLDLFVPTSGGNLLYVNDGNGTLVESGANRGVASYTGSAGGFVRGATVADVDGDSDVDVLVFGSGASSSDDVSDSSSTAPGTGDADDPLASSF
jgi:hypothetical protein